MKVIGCFIKVSMMFKQCFKGVLMMFQGVLVRKSPICFRELSGVSLECFKECFKVFQGCYVFESLL